MCADCDQLADLTGDDMEPDEEYSDDCPGCGETTYGSPAIIRPSEGPAGVTWHINCYLTGSCSWCLQLVIDDGTTRHGQSMHVDCAIAQHERDYAEANPF